MVVSKTSQDLNTLGFNKRFPHVRPSTTSVCSVQTADFGEAAVVSCSRRYNPPTTTGFFSPWTAIANRVVGAESSVPASVVNTAVRRHGHGHRHRPSPTTFSDGASCRPFS